MLKRIAGFVFVLMVLVFTIGSVSAVFDCGGDLECMRNYMDDCTPSKVTNFSSFNFIGLEFNITSYYELKGIQGGECVAYHRYENIDFDFSDSVKDAKISQGFTSEIINREVIQNNFQYDKLEGKDSTCKYIADSNLKANMEDNWSVSSYVLMIDTTKPSECEGNLYDLVGGIGFCILSPYLKGFVYTDFLNDFDTFEIMDIKSNGDVVVEVEGVSETISESFVKTVNGLKIRNLKTDASTDLAILEIGCGNDLEYISSLNVPSTPVSFNKDFIIYPMSTAVSFPQNFRVIIKNGTLGVNTHIMKLVITI
ncbi:hypothetical protein J4481_01185 [Candidatus Pacearchaeota archaeon]|nr:hypothetical protein [Candidatus Pacearchaeota archaeon]